MFKNDKKRKNLFYKFSIVIPLFFLMWGVVGVYSVMNSTPYLSEQDGKISAITYKGQTMFITKLQYILIIVLPLLGLLSVPFLVIITSPRLGLFGSSKTDD
jgi:hypothetical protein